jgi:hypothetical protein
LKGRIVAMADITRKRAILFSARVQFSPEMQPIQETAIDKLIEQSLFIGDRAEGLTIQQIESQRTFSFVDGIPAISQREALQSLKRLESRDRIVAQLSHTGTRYRLSDRAMNDLRTVQHSAETRLSRIVGLLFRDAERDADEYTDAFLECLCNIFAHLGDYYVQVLQAKVSREDWLRAPRIGQAVQAVSAKYQCAKDTSFGRAIRQFFAEDDPDYNKVKWNLAQNYYLAKTLGLDAGSALLSNEVFGNARFYLDTNILFQAVEPRMRHNRSFRALIAACKRLGTTAHVCQISIDEMRNAVGHNRELIMKVADQIPENMSSHVRGGLYELYHDELQQHGTVDIDALFENFIRPMDVLTPQYNVELVDDEWFVAAREQADVQAFIRKIMALAQQRQRPKYKGSAQHDALMLRWIQKDREAGSRNTWLVTLDMLLPNVGTSNGKQESRPLAITLDALLQWISPIAIQEAGEDEIAAIFAEAVKFQLLPQDGFFELRDFLVFTELQMSCKDLPTEDVEACLQYIRTNASHLNPADAKDLQILGREIQKFFADPSRKYKQDLARLEEENAQKDAALQQVTTNLSGKIDDLHRQLSEQLLAQQRQHESQLAAQQHQHEETLVTMRREREEEERQRAATALRRSARIRLGIGIGYLAVFTSIAIFLTVSLGDQAKSVMERIKDAWMLPTAIFAICLVLTGFFLGRKRIQALDLPGANWWKQAGSSDSSPEAKKGTK